MQLLDYQIIGIFVDIFRKERTTPYRILMFVLRGSTLRDSCWQQVMESVYVFGYASIDFFSITELSLNN